MGKSTHLAILSGRLGKIQISQGMSTGSIRLDAIKIQKIFAHNMRGTITRFAYANIDAWLTKINRQQLRMTICHMQEMYIAKTGQVIKSFGGLFCGKGTMGKTHSTGGSYGHDLHEIATINHIIHFLKKLMLTVWGIFNQIKDIFFRHLPWN